MMPGLQWEAGRFRSSWYKLLVAGSMLALAGILAEGTMVSVTTAEQRVYIQD